MMVKFDENQILKNGEYIYAQRAEIEKIADAVCEKGFDNILFTSSGGSLAMMQPFDYMISVMSNLNVQSQVSAELLVEGNNHLTDKTLVFMASKSGDTKETVAAAKYVKEKGATIVSVLGVDNSPLGELSDYSVVYKDGRPQEYVLYMLIGKLLENKGFFNDYKQFADELKNLPAALVSVGKASEPKARAYAAAGSDARMSGCELPVVINSGSGNQGITVSVPVIIYAKEYHKSDEELLRALLVSNLIAIHIKTGIGPLSAFCGAVSAGCAAGCAIAFLLGGGIDEVAHTLVNSIAITSGIICDGAKPSCAAKIASSVDAGILGYEMYRHGQQFYGEDGIVSKGVENTIRNICRIGAEGMNGTDEEIIKIMTHCD